MRLLVVEDEPKLGQLLARNLARDQFAVDLATNLADADAFLRTTDYALVLLDLGLPDGSGLSLLKSVRASRSKPPVIILTAQDAVQDRIKGLNAGADDYIGKPFAHEELSARIGAVLRRPGASLGAVLKAGEVTMHSTTRSVTICGDPVQLPRRELVMLELLLRNPGVVISRERMEEAIYDHGDEPLSNAIEANMYRLRKRLRDHKARVTIQALRGLGYMLHPDDEAQT